MKSRTLTCITAISLFAALAVPLQLAAQRYIVTDIGTLGGTFTEANALNNKGWVVGFAENTTPDPTCVAPQVLHFKPVLWEKGQIQELPTFPGDPDGVALVINDNGQAAGASGNCHKDSPEEDFHALLWTHGTVIDL